MRSISLRRPGFANSLILRIGLLVVLSLAAFTAGINLLIVRPTVDRLAETQMNLAGQQIEARFGRLLQTVERTLRTGRDWGKHGDFSGGDLLRFNEFFFPVLRNHGEITSVIFASQSGREIFLLLGDDGTWRNRISDPAAWGKTVYWISWNAQREIVKVEARESDYDARRRPWFVGAMQQTDEQQIFWTSPYIFYTTQEPGITAALRWTAANGETYVIGHDVRLSDIATFTTSVTLGARGRAALFEEDGKLLAPPKSPRFASRQAINEALLKTPDELQLPVFSQAYRLWQAAPANREKLAHFESGNERWLSLFKRFNGASPGIWFGVVAPESDFAPFSGRDQALVLLIGGLALLFGMVVAARLARKFGEPLKALAEESERIGRQELAEPVSTKAPWYEIKQLGNALEGMRQHLLDSRQAMEQINADLEATITQRTQSLRESQERLQRREAFFHAVFDNAAVGIVSLDAQRQPKLVNRAFAQFIRHPIDSLLQHPDTVVLPADEQQRMDKLLAAIGEGKLPGLRDEFEFVDRHGQSRWGDLQITPIRKEDGSLDSLLVTILDISDRREIETELIRQFGFLQALIDTIPNPIFYKGADTRFLGCNKAYESFFGIDRHDFIGKRVLDLEYLPLAARQSYQQEDEQVIAECGRRIHEVQMQAADGNIHDTLYSVTAFRTPDGAPGGLIGVIVDISAQKNAEREADKARAAAEAAAETKANFLANMSHEIRTPMNAILGMTHLALQTDLTARQTNYLHKVETAAKGLLGIINDILDLSKIEAGMMRFENTPFSLEESLRHLADLCALKALDKNLELLFDIRPGVPDRLVGDALRLGQVLLNLVGNAIKFTEAGEVTVTVDLVEQHETSVALRFEVRDTGIGMNAEQLSRLFTAFTQADDSTTRKYGGTGLGLSICKRIVDLLGGEITAESQPGIGSRFEFRLAFPLAADPDSPSERIGIPGRLPTLVVDDNPGARQIFSQILQAMAIDCQTVADGPNALAALAAAAQAGEPYRLVIIDWKMPDMDGVALLREIVSRPAGEPPLCILTTAHDQEALNEALGELPVNAILAKPVTPSSLFDAIMLALHRKPQPQQASRPAGQNQRRFAGQRVLIVEDNEVNSELAAEMLQGLGLTVDLAGNGAQAIDYLARQACDLVLMDCQMPVMDGYEATRRIRQMAGFARLPIIAMTANALAGDRDKCLAAGMNDHISKPIDIAVLGSTIAYWLGQTPSPTATDSPAQAASTGPEIDLEGASRRLGGSRQLLARLITRFRDNQADAVQHLRAALQRADYTNMRLLAHTLRGVAGNIGANRIARCAADLENMLAADPPPANEPIDQQLALLETALNAFLAVDLQISGKSAEPAIALTDEAAQAICKELLKLLETADAAASGEFARIEGWLRETADPGLVDRLARMIGNYDFDHARDTLQIIVERTLPQAEHQ